MENKNIKIVVIAAAIILFLFVGLGIFLNSGYDDSSVTDQTYTQIDAPSEPVVSLSEISTEQIEAGAVEESEGFETNEESEPAYRFRNERLLNEHYEKHGIEMGFASAESYQAAASAVITNPNSLFKIEAEDGDGVYYLEATNEFVVLSTDGYIRTYFLPSSGKAYFDRQ